MYKYLALLACVALAQGMVRREATTSSPLADLEKHAGEIQKTFQENLNKLVESPQTKEFQKTLKEGSDSVLQQLSTLTNSLQSALADANGKAKEFLEQSRASLQKTSADLQAQHPELQQDVAQLKARVEAAVSAAAGEASRTAQELQRAAGEAGDALAPKLRDAYKNFLNHAEDLQKKLHEAATKQ